MDKYGDLEKRIARLPIKSEESFWSDTAKKLTSRKTEENLVYARSIVIDIHLNFEIYLNLVISVLVHDGMKHLGLASEIRDIKTFFEEPSLSYFKKYELIKKLKIFSEYSLNVLKQTNKVRNAFAHRSSDDEKYLYKNHSILTKETISLLMDDFIRVNQEFFNFIYREK